MEAEIRLYTVPPLLKAILVINIIPTALGLLIPFFKEQFDLVSDSFMILNSLVVIAVLSWLLIKPSRTSYMATIYLALISFILNTINFLIDMKSYNVAPVIIPTIFGAYVYSSFKNSQAPERTQAKQMFKNAQEAERRRSYAEAERLYKDILTFAPGTPEAELATEAISFLPKQGSK